MSKTSLTTKLYRLHNVIKTNGGYYLVPHMLNQYCIKKRNHNIDTIIPNFLYLSSRQARDQLHLHNNFNIKYNISFLRPETDSYSNNQLHKIFLPIEDHENYDLSTHYGAMLNWLQHIKQQQQKVIFNCADGMSRSVAMVMAYLLLTNNKVLPANTVSDAIQFLIQQRGIIGPNPGFIRQLYSLESQ